MLNIVLFERKFSVIKIFDEVTNEIKSFHAILIDGKSYSKDWSNADYGCMMADYNDLLNIFITKIGRYPDKSYEYYAEYMFEWGLIRVSCNKRDFLVGFSVNIVDKHIVL